MTERIHTFTRDDGETVVEVHFEITSWGAPASWTDPAEAPEIDIVSVMEVERASPQALPRLVDLTPEENERAQIEIYEGDYFDYEDGPDPDDLRDAEIDRRLCEGR